MEIHKPDKETQELVQLARKLGYCQVQIDFHGRPGYEKTWCVNFYGGFREEVLKKGLKKALYGTKEVQDILETPDYDENVIRTVQQINW